MVLGDNIFVGLVATPTFMLCCLKREQIKQFSRR